MIAPDSDPATLFGRTVLDDAVSLSDLRTALYELTLQEKAVTSKLNQFVATQRDLFFQLNRLDTARAALRPQVTHVREIGHGILEPATATASRISTAVKRLDTEQAAVKDTLQVVEQVVELKSCVLGVHGALEGTQDWELAATYVHRALKIPKAIIEGVFAEEIVPTAEVPDPPRITLHNAAANLCNLFLRDFDKAVKDGDGAQVTRIFKLFPLIGRQDTGLDAYGRYVCSGVASRARSNLASSTKKDGQFYTVALTRLFEHVAQIVENHEPIISRHYGPGMMEKVVQRLQSETDLQGGIILDTWTEEGHVSRKMTDVKSYAFAFLVQSFLPAQRPALKLRSASPMAKDVQSHRQSEDEGVDMKEIDALLNQTATMLNRWALYSRFISMKTSSANDQDLTTLSAVIEHSTLQRKSHDCLIEPFNILTTFYFRRSVEKAFQMDEAPQDLSLNASKPLSATPPYITSAVDDVMYILNQVVQRSLATAQRQVVANVFPAISRVLNGDFYGMIQRQMRDESYPKAAPGAALPSESIIVAFLVLMNNLEVSTDYVRRIVESQLSPEPDERAHDAASTSRLYEVFAIADDATFAETQLRGILTSFATKAAELLSDAVDVLLRHVLRPRLRPVLAEAFRDASYALSRDDSVTIEQDDDSDPIARRFERGWAAFMLPIKRITSERNYESIHTATVQHLARMLEKRIWSQQDKITALGAIRLERDITEIIAVAVRGANYRLRDHFAKITQMLLVLNMDEEEWEEHKMESKRQQADNYDPLMTVIDIEESRKVRDMLLP